VLAAWSSGDELLAQNPLPEPYDLPLGNGGGSAGEWAEDSQLAEPYGVPLDDQDACGPPGQIWARAEYLLWWTKSSLLPPLLTTSPPGTPLGTAGVLGSSGTSVLFGGSGFSANPRSGGRFTLGTWLDNDNTFGVEANFFALESRSAPFYATSSGSPILVRPFFNSDTGLRDNLFVAFPGFVQGTFKASVSSSNLYGGEMLLRQNLLCGCNYRVDLLGGYRFLHLNEGLDIAESEINTDPNAPIPVGFRIDLTDSYHTRNSFNGGQLGIDGEYRFGQFYVDTLAKLALGDNGTLVTLGGSTRIDPFTTAVPGGFLVSPAQVGQFRRNSFAVVPEGGLRVGWQVTDYVRVFAGYTFLYWTNVARPGDQASLAVSLLRLPPGAAGPPQPLNIKTSDYWAQGLTVGVECRY